MYKYFIRLPLILFLFITIYPNNSYDIRNNIHRKTVNKEEDFEKFLNTFFKDKSFQKSRIVFPLKGGKDDQGVGEITTNLTWKENQWKFIHYKVILKNNLSIEQIQNLIKKDSDYYCKIEKNRQINILKIIHNGWGEEFHFALKGDKWYLIYYIPQLA